MLRLKSWARDRCARARLGLLKWTGGRKLSSRLALMGQRLWTSLGPHGPQGRCQGRHFGAIWWTGGISSPLSTQGGRVWGPTCPPPRAAATVTPTRRRGGLQFICSPPRGGGWTRRCATSQYIGVCVMIWSFHTSACVRRQRLRVTHTECQGLPSAQWTPCSMLEACEAFKRLLSIKNCCTVS